MGSGTLKDQTPERIRRIPSGVVLLLGLVIILASAPAQAAVAVYNGSDASYTLQDAIRAASPGDTILLRDGTYNGSLAIDRQITLRALDDRHPPYLHMPAGGSGINITAKGVILDSLNITGSGGRCGLSVQSDNNRISNVSVSGFLQGICMEAAVNNDLEHNRISGNAIGIVLDKESQADTIFLNYFDNPVDVVSSSDEVAWSNPPGEYLYRGRSYTGSLGNYWEKYSGTATPSGVGISPYTIQQNGTGVSGSKNRGSATDMAPLTSLPDAYILMPRDRQQPEQPVSAPPAGTIPPRGDGAFPASARGPGDLNGGGTGTSGGPPPFPGALVQFWWIVPIAIVISAAAGIWYERTRRDRHEQGMGGHATVPADNNATVVRKPTPATEEDSRADLHHYAARLPPALEKKYPGAQYLAEGGASRIFHAYDPVEGRDVAVKVPIRFDEVTGTQFTKELHVWQSLHHKNIVEIYAANIFPVPYIEMEYVASSLASMKFPLDQKTAASIVKGVAEGLLYAHERGIAHRDIKPGNILITPEGVPKITDWGLAKAEGTKQSGIIGFSLEYAAPEQLAPNLFGEPGAWTDIYQLGVLYYEMVSGQVPFVGGGMGEVTHAILHDSPSALSKKGIIGGGAEAIIFRCLKKHPRDRYQSVAELLTDLDNLRFF